MKRFGYVLFCLLLSCIFSLSCIPPRTSYFAYVNSSHPRSESPTIVKKIYIDANFGESDRVAIEDALAQWEYALNGYMAFKTETYDVEKGPLGPMRETVKGQTWMFMKIDSMNPLVDFHDKPRRPALAFCESIGGSMVYLVRDRVPNASVKGVMMHEIGHLLGAVHMEETDDLMNPLYSDDNSQCIDKHTLEQVAEHLHIPVQNMNYCVYAEMARKPDVEVTTVTVIHN